jgi:hypothetical protein
MPGQQASPGTWEESQGVRALDLPEHCGSADGERAFGLGSNKESEAVMRAITSFLAATGLAMADIWAIERNGRLRFLIGQIFGFCERTGCSVTVW